MLKDYIKVAFQKSTDNGTELIIGYCLFKLIWQNLLKEIIFIIIFWQVPNFKRSKNVASCIKWLVVHYSCVYKVRDLKG